MTGMTVTAECVQVIRVTWTTGRGIPGEGDPVRVVTSYYSLDGELLAENDPCAPPLDR